MLSCFLDKKMMYKEGQQFMSTKPYGLVRDQLCTPAPRRGLLKAYATEAKNIKSCVWAGRPTDQPSGLPV